MTADTFTIRRPDDFHVHLRDGEMLRAVLPHTAKQFARALVMPNLVPPVCDVSAAVLYRERILSALPEGAQFEPLMSCYLTDQTDPKDVEAGYASKVFAAVKLYPAHATTNSHFGVRDMQSAYPVFARMEKIGMPLLIHGEDTSPSVDIFDRERSFIERTLAPLLARFEGLKIVLEHITTAFAVRFVRSQGGNRLAATITPHHLFINRNAIFDGGLRPHAYCLPIAKREEDRLALRKAAASGEACFFLGTDSAPHAKRAKENDCGCAGIFCAPVALESYVQVFEEENALEHFESFASVHGARFYGIPLNEDRIVLRRQSRPAAPEIPVGNDSVRSFRSGEELQWVLD